MSDWQNYARTQLLKRRNRSGLWGYRREGSPAVEATALASLGVYASWVTSPPDFEGAAVERAADWLEAMQQPGGSLGISPALPSPGWSTPYASLLWQTLGGHTEARRRAADWLLAQHGDPVSADESSKVKVLGHDPNLIGWSWIAGTHSWLEPTALAIMALAREGLAAHPRALEGVVLLRDRALSHGGWNYGNTTVFGRELRPQPAPTGLALVALSHVPGRDRPRCIDRALTYLQRTLVDVRAPSSLGWGVLGLRSWNACPHVADTWLAESWSLHEAARDGTAGLALLLLAAGLPVLCPMEPLP
jgi:hypothetical protein